MGLRLGPNDYRQASVDFCVVFIEVKPDYQMVFNVSWTANFPAGVTATKRSDANNSNMYIEDNLGKRYLHIATGGAAAQDVNMKNGDTVYGWFVFPPAEAGATSFTFFDANQDESIAGLVLTDPLIIYGELSLTWYPYVLDYKLEFWQSGVTEDGGGMLTHLEYPSCQIIEWQPSEPEGKYINTIDIGAITYDIFRFYDPAVNWSTREYIVKAGLENLDPQAPPFLRVAIPFDNSDACLLDVSEVLAHLRPPSPETP